MKKSIEVTWQFEGQHCWPSAPEEVAFLRNLHRHIFHCRVQLEVYHEDREVEFILLKREMESRTLDWLCNESDSCEHMATRILDYLQKRYPYRRAKVWVSEDGENAAIITNED